MSRTLLYLLLLTWEPFASGFASLKGLGLRRCQSYGSLKAPLRLRMASSDGSKNPGLESFTQLFGDVAYRNAAVQLAGYGAILGPLLDNYHSAFKVLQYERPVVVSLGETTLLTTAWWVPPVFALAAVSIGTLYIAGDTALGTSPQWRRPSWPAVQACVGYFSAQYYISGLLCAVHAAPADITWILAALLAAGYAIFDRTVVGLVVGLATATLGPAAELFLVNGGVFHEYHYLPPEPPEELVFGVRFWIPLVYYLGAPAVGNLARALYSGEKERLER